MAWITGTELAAYTGQDYDELDADEQARFDDRAVVASDWAFTRRAKYGRPGTIDEVPSTAVREGTLMFGVILLRDQGAYDGAASFSDFAGTTFTTGGSWGQVQRLLGIPGPIAV